MNFKFIVIILMEMNNKLLLTAINNHNYKILMQLGYQLMGLIKVAFSISQM